MTTFQTDLVKELLETIKKQTTAQIELIETRKHRLDDIRKVARIGSQLVSLVTSPLD